MAVRIPKGRTRRTEDGAGSHRELERRVMNAYLERQPETRRTTTLPTVVCMVGLVGAGKSTVAREIAARIGGTVVESNALRVLLREQGQGYGSVRALAAQVCVELLTKDSNVVLDSDFIDAEKRDVLARKLRGFNVRIMLVRVVCDIDLMIGRIITALPDEFFAGASSSWSGEHRATVVKLREMIRRMEHHYRWEKQGGGRMILRKPPFRVDAVIDTSAPDWKDAVEDITKHLS